MAERDPCELFPEQEVEEEVDPEYQDTGLTDLTTQTAESATSNPNSAQNLTETQSAGVSPEPETDVPTVPSERARVAASAAERISRQLNGDEGEVLENDISLTPIGVTGRAATKSTWIINNASLLDTGLIDTAQGLKFTSKPLRLLARGYRTPHFALPGRAPSNVIDSSYQIDPIRWVSDRMWFNSEQADGPQEFVTSDRAKQNHLKPVSSPDFYFINKDPSPEGWGLLYEDRNKRLTIRAYLQDTDPSQWKNIQEIVNLMNSEGGLGLEPKYEIHELYAEKLLNSAERWNWARYFLGLPSPENRILITGQNTMQRMREEANNQTLYIGWKTIYSKYLEETNRASLNAFPFVPFYGDPFSLSDSSRTPVFPTTGRRFYTDYTTNIEDLLTKQESDVLDVGDKSYFDFRPVYSYYDCLYEKTFSSVLNEKELPSPYIREIPGFETSSRRGEGLTLPRIEDFEEQQFIRLSAADGFLALNFYDGYDPSLATEAQVQEVFAQTVNRAAAGNPDAIRDLAKYMSENFYAFNIDNQEEDIYISRLNTEVLDEIYERRYINPMFVEMEFGSIEKSVLSEALTFNGDNTLMKNLFGNLRQQQFQTQIQQSVLSGQDISLPQDPVTTLSYVDQLLQSGLNGLDNLDTSIEFSDTIPLTETRTLDFSKWYRDLFNFYTSGVGMTPAEKFANIFRMLLIKGKVATFVKSRARTYDEILSGVPAKSEVLGFTIDKYSIDRRGEETYINSFHILSNNDREVERFVDTQVKYGQLYEYRINRIVAVVGNKYAYANPNLDGQPMNDMFEEAFRTEDPTAARTDDSVFRCPLGVVNMPYLQILSVPSTTKRTVVADRPPLYPNVDVIPFKGEQNKVMFNLSSNCGEYLAPPVVLEDDDNLQFYTVAFTQGLQSVQDLTADNVENFNFSLESDLTDAELIRFNSDDPATTFEVFRMDTYPKSITDFRGKKIRKDFTNADNFSFIDNIVPNKKYYYVFRCEDVHGHVSNPSLIHEVEIVTVNDASRVNVRIVEPEDIETKRKLARQTFQSARQFVSIKPSFPQKTLQLPDSGNFSELTDTGNKDDIFGEPGITKLWGKKFKLRIRSKNTGKEVDVNFRFKVKVRKNEENKKVNLIC